MTFVAAGDAAFQRLDLYLQQQLPQYSRSRLQQWIQDGRVLVNGAARRPSYTLRSGDRIDVEPGDPAPLRAQPEEIPLDILYEDADVVAIHKPAGMVVHAGAGVHAGTLVNALLHRFRTLSAAGGPERPGIVHRLDKETSGVILVARNDAAHRALAAQFAGRQVEKRYVALVRGSVRHDQGRIDKPIARDPAHRTRMTARMAKGRAALSEYRVLRRFGGFTLVEVRIGTGRTHQIRVHLASIGHPVAGDRLYGGPPSPCGRFFLHAASVRFSHPVTGAPIEIAAPLPLELDQWVDGLRPA